MSSVTPINSGRLSATPPVDPPAGETFVAGDLVAAMDDHSRALLGRSDLERRIRLVPRSLMIADLLGLSLAYLITTLFWGGSGAFGSTKQLVVFCCTLPSWLVVARLQGLYRADQEHADHSTADDIVKVFYLVTIGVWILLVASRLAGHTAPGIYALITFWVLTICVLPMVRTVTRRLCRRSRAYVQNTLILGAGEVGQLIARKLVRHAEYGLNVVGFLDREPKVRRGTCRTTSGSSAARSGWRRWSRALTLSGSSSRSLRNRRTNCLRCCANCGLSPCRSILYRACLSSSDPV